MHDTPGGSSAIGIRPAVLHIVDPALAARVAAPAYDSLSAAERIRIAAGDPLSYLNVLQTPEDDGGDLRAALRSNRRVLQRLLHDGVFHSAPGPRFAWYRLAVNGHEQTALIAEVAIDDYEAGRIVRHEHTRADREEHLAVYLETVAASSSPVSLAYADDQRLTSITGHATAADPVMAFTSADGVEHTIWTTGDPAACAEISAAAQGLSRLYITDGHHRLAAAARVAASGRAAGHGRDAPDQWVLAALFPAGDLRILPFHRAVLRPRDITTPELLSSLRERGDVRVLDGPATPDRPHSFVTWVDGGWYELSVSPGDVAPGVLQALDVMVLQDHVLGPVFGVLEPRFDPRLAYVPGGPAEVAAYCEERRAVGFVLRATSMDELMAVADAELVMPPKSTRFDPKTRSGIFLRLSG